MSNYGPQLLSAIRKLNEVRVAVHDRECSALLASAQGRMVDEYQSHYAPRGQNRDNLGRFTRMERA